jgi:general secretion pathway protein K
MRTNAVTRGCNRNEQGFALVLVMWGLAILSLMAVAMIDEARHAARLGAARVGETQAGLLAEAGIERALVAIDETPSDRAWPENGTPREWDFAGGRTIIADAIVIAALKHAGLTDARQQKIDYEFRLAHAQSLFAGSDAEVASLDELKQITSLTDDEIRRLRPIMTLRTQLQGFDPQVANPATIRLIPGLDDSTVQQYLADRAQSVARADADDRPASPAPAFTVQSPRKTFSVHVEACTADGHLAIREAMIHRTAPGKFERLEMRQPLQPRFMTGGCPASVKTASTHL